MIISNNNKKQIRFFTFAQFHNRPLTGSSFIRATQLINNWPEADLYKYGENPDVLVFQKVYAGLDYKFPSHFEGIKILDICDPDWMRGRVYIKETIDAVDAVTCPTETLRMFLAQLTDKPVVVIKDRFDISAIPPPVQHKDRAKTVVWFGYRHNADLLRPAMPLIDELGLKLIIISDDDPILYQFSNRERKDFYTFIKYNEDTFYQDIQNASFAILPVGNRPQDVFKSENKTIKANLAGLPVAKDADDVRTYMEAANRQLFIDNDYANIKEEYDVRKSVSEMKQLIERLQKD